MYLQIFEGFSHIISARSISRLKLGAVFALLESCVAQKKDRFCFLTEIRVEKHHQDLFVPGIQV